LTIIIDNNIEEQYGEYFDHAELPDELKGLKACLSCSLVKTYAQFYDQGCDNCEYLRMKDDARKVKSSTTSYFEGLIALIEPQNSWVAKWQRIVQMKPGMYAIEVSGKLLDEEDVNEDDDLIDDM
jgi:transcription elongation factor SPT4